MPQLDLITFVDQTFYVYVFFILQYVIISIFVLPGLYQVLIIKRLLYESLLCDVHNNMVLLLNLIISLDMLEFNFEHKIKN